MAPEVPKMEKGDPEPENGAAGPETILNKGFRAGCFCTKPTSLNFALLGTKKLKMTKSRNFAKMQNQYCQSLKRNDTTKDLSIH